MYETATPFHPKSKFLMKHAGRNDFVCTSMLHNLASPQPPHSKSTCHAMSLRGYTSPGINACRL